MQHKLSIQGHRGCRGLLPENTIPAFIKALELGVDTIELDVVAIKGNQVLVSHEPYLAHEYCFDFDGNPIAKEEERRYNFYEMDYEKIRKIDCGSKKHPRFPFQKNLKTYKPLLKDTIKLLDDYAIQHQLPLLHYNIEIKRYPEETGFYPSAEILTNAVLEIIDQYSIIDRVTVQSFDLDCLRVAKKSGIEHLNIGLLIESEKDFVKNIETLGFCPGQYGPYFELIDSALVAYMQSNGIRLIPWTVNEVVDMKKLIELGVDGIITDYPDRLLALVGRL